MPSNRRLPSEPRRKALATVRSQYDGFGPTLADEKLTELHGLRLSAEALRRWMTRDGLWVPRGSPRAADSGEAEGDRVFCRRAS